MEKRYLKFLAYVKRILYKASDELLILACTLLITLFVLNYWVTNYSDVCNAKTFSTFRENYISHIFNVESTQPVLDTTRSDTAAELVVVDLYTEDYDYVLDYSFSGAPEWGFRMNTTLIPVTGDVYYEELYEAHSFQRCISLTNGDIVNPSVKRILSETELIEAVVSCPFQDSNNFLLGSVTAFYSTKPEDKDDVNFLNLETVERKMKVYALAVRRAIGES